MTRLCGLALAIGACRHPDGPTAPAPSGPTLAFDLGGGLFDAPFPNVHRVTPAGADLSGWPNPDEVAYVEALIGLGPEGHGAGTTSGVLFRREPPDTALVPVDLARSLEGDAEVFLVAVDGPEAGARVPVDVWDQADGGPFGAPGLVTVLPLQGAPLAPNTTYAAVIRRSAGADGPLGVPDALWALTHGAGDDAAHAGAIDALRAFGVDVDEIAGLAVLRTGDPVAELARAVAAAPPAAPREPLQLVDTFDTYCVFEGTIEVPNYQAGEPPFTAGGGGWVPGDDGLPVPQGEMLGRIWVTVPRAPADAGGYPVTVMVRTGGGGDRPLVDRGVRDADGVAAPGTGPAVELARIGHVGVQVDGPHGGPYRNPTGADEQFLMFNVGNPVATRDNVRQSALELALLPDLLARLSIDAAACPGADPAVPLDLDAGIALFGHSMGATIAPLVVAAAPAYRRVVLSGAGGSYLANLVYKQSPLEVRPLAEALLGFTDRGRRLEEGDAVLQLLQWLSEPADPPPYARAADPGVEVLMVQGIVDTYILPPMANAMSVAWGLDLAGPALDADAPGLEGMRPLEAVLAYGGGEAVALPARGRVVVQFAEDGVEDGHEVAFQRDDAKRAWRCFLATGEVPAPDADPLAPCE